MPIRFLFDHLVGAGEQRLRHGEAEGLSGRQVDHQLELGRLLDRQVGGFGAFEDPDRVYSGRPIGDRGMSL
jgi:hypothetical protein